MITHPWSRPLSARSRMGLVIALSLGAIARPGMAQQAPVPAPGAVAGSAAKPTPALPTPVVAAPVVPQTAVPVPGAGGGGAPQGARLTDRLKGMVDSLNTPTEYVREVFHYAKDRRPDPVTPPASLRATHTFPVMTLSGIVFNERAPTKSYAMVRFADQQPARRAVRSGDHIDQYTIVAISRTHVTVDIRVFGGIRRVFLVPDIQARSGAPDRSRTGPVLRPNPGRTP